MRAAEDILEHLRKIPMHGPLVIPLPKAFKGICLYCGRKTNLIANYSIQKDKLGDIVFRCIKKNIKNVSMFRYPISVCNEDCLLREIEDVVDCILEDITQ